MAAVGVLTETRSKLSAPRAKVFKITYAWTSSAGGAVSGILSAGVVGILTRATFIPGAAGAAPTALYDVVLLDAEGVDLLNTLGANRSATVTESVAPMLGAGANVPVAVAGSIELQVANAGNAKSGTIALYFTE